MRPPSSDRLPPRLAALAVGVAPGSRVADIGTDHGLLPLWLARRGRASLCVATEATERLLARVRRPPEGAAWGKRLVYRSGDGLEALRPGDGVDTVVVAGMGGRAIVRLLSAPAGKRLGVGRLVLQPRTSAPLVRRWLSAAGWRLISERLTEERGRLHLTVVAQRGDDTALYRHSALSRGDLLESGPLLARGRSALWVAAWRRERDRLAAIVASGSDGPAIDRATARLARARRILAATSRRAG